jgi:hypothetical protein
MELAFIGKNIKKKIGKIVKISEEKLRKVKK